MSTSKTLITQRLASTTPWKSVFWTKQHCAPVEQGWEPNQPLCAMNGKSNATLRLLRKRLKILKFLKTAREKATDRARQDHSPGVILSIQNKMCGLRGKLSLMKYMLDKR